MDDGFGIGLLLGAIVALLVGFVSYSGGEKAVQAQAVAAGVACYEAKQSGGVSDFRWNCKK